MGKGEVVVDTNVPLVANGKAEQADLECEVACVRKLIQIQSEHGIQIVFLCPELMQTER